MKLLGLPGKKFPTDLILVDEHQCLQDEGVDCSFVCMTAFVWDFKGSQSSRRGTSLGTLRTLWEPLIIPHKCSHTVG
jgi:hypothetical protein